MAVTAITLIIALCLGGVFGGLGIGLLLFGNNQRKRGGVSQNWPAVMGTVLSANLSQQSRRNSQGYHDVTYAPVVEYTYEVNGNSYRSDKINSGWTVSYDLSTAQNKINQYQPGASVTVHYNPANPADAVLETHPVRDWEYLYDRGWHRPRAHRLYLLFGGGLLTVHQWLDEWHYE